MSRKQEAAIYEVTDEEAAKLQQEIDEQKGAKKIDQPASDTEPSQPLDDEAKDKIDRTKLKANKGNGCNLEKYNWTQTSTEIDLRVKLEIAVKPRDVIVKALKNKLFVGLKGQPAIIDGELFGDVRHTELTWLLENEGKTIAINLEKPNEDDWWNRLMTTDPEIKLPPETKYNSLGYKIETQKVRQSQAKSFMAGQNFA